MRMQAVLDVLYPPQCLVCDARTIEPYALCGRCLRDVIFATSLACDRCAQPLPGDSDRPELCDSCLQNPPPWRRARATMWYGPGAQRLIMPLKYADRTDLARPLGSWVAQTVRDLVRPDTVLVPVPLYWRRRIRRRYNQAALLSAAMAKCLHLRSLPGALRRVRHTPSLGHMMRAERAKVLEGAIVARCDLAGYDVILVDDVMTTGSTLRACANAVLTAGASSVSVAVLARTGIND